MVILNLYLVSLLLAPQLWLSGLKGIPVDYFLYPAWFVALLLSGRLPQFFRFQLADKLFLAFVVWIICGVLINGATEATVTQIYAYLKLFLLYKMVSATLVTVTEVKRVLLLFTILASVLAVETIQHKLGSTGLGWAGQTLDWIDPSVIRAGGSGRARWVGIFDGPGVFCVVFTIAVAVVLPFLDKDRPLRSRLFAVCVLALLAIATYYTGSRGGLLATLAIVGIYIAIRGNVSLRSIMVGAAIAVTAFTLAPPWMTQMRDESNSAQHRVEMWAEGLDMMKEDPVFGIGRGNFKVYTQKLIAHNSAIELGGETGLVGLMLWGCLLLVSFKSAIGAWQRGETADHQTVGFSLVLILVGYLVSAMFVTLEYETLYFVLALCAVLGREHVETQSLGRWEVAGLAGCTGVGLVFLQVFVLAYMS